MIRFDNILGGGFPAAVIFVSAVSVPSIAVPIIKFIFLGLQHTMNFVIHHAGQIISFSSFVQRCHDLAQLSHRFTPAFLFLWRGSPRISARRPLPILILIVLREFRYSLNFSKRPPDDPW